MSLKAFHVFFVIVSTVCALFFGAWCVMRSSQGGGGAYLIAAAASGVIAVVLTIYGFWFLRKLKDVNSP